MVMLYNPSRVPNPTWLTDPRYPKRLYDLCFVLNFEAVAEILNNPIERSTFDLSFVGPHGMTLLHSIMHRPLMRQHEPWEYFEDPFYITLVFMVMSTVFLTVSKAQVAKY